MTTLYLKLTRTRTGETRTLRLEEALRCINTYNDKQKFMNMLGQEDFWKKNRLLLWKDLTALDIKDTDEYKYDDFKAETIQTDFINTEIMLNQIKYRLQSYYDTIFTKREESIIAEQERHFTHTDDNYYNNNIGRCKSLRTRRVNPEILSVRHADMESFNKELNALYKKYGVKDTIKIKNGKRYFNTYDLAQKMVKLYYKL